MAAIDPAGNIGAPPLLFGGYTPPPAPSAQASPAAQAPAPTPQAVPAAANYTGGPLTPQQATQLAMQAGFTGPGLVDIVAIMGRESGYDPTAQNPTSGALGLTQINWSTWPNLVPLMQSLGYNVQDTQQAVSMLTDPTVNLRIAYAVSNGGTDFSDWNLTTPGTYLDATDVPTAQAVVQQVTGQTYQPTTQGTMGNSMADAAQQGGVQFAGAAGRGIQLVQNGSSGNPVSGVQLQDAGSGSSFNPATASSNIGTLTNQLATYLAQNPTEAYLIAPVIQSLEQEQQSLLSLSNNVWVNPNTGQTVPFTQLPPDQLAQIQASNENAYKTLVNNVMNTNWANTLGAQNAGNTALSTQFQNQISAFGQQIAAGDMTLAQANDALQRWMDANTTAQNLTQDIQNAQDQAEQWGTSNGQTAFSAASIGAAGTRLAQQAGIDPNATLLQFPGVQTMNPVGNYMQTLGALGQALNPPAIPNVAGTLGAVPTAPVLNSTFTPPVLQQPTQFPSVTSTAPPLGSSIITPRLVGGIANP